jgi:hypothetical protein
MPIDASIPLGVRPFQVENPVNQLAKVMQIQSLQQDGQMNRLKMDEYQRSVTDATEMRNALSAPDADPYKVLIQRGKVKEATDFLKGKADVDKTGAETEAKKLEAAHRRLDFVSQVFGAVKNNPTLQTANQALDMLEQNGIFPPDKIATWRANAAANPGSIQQFAEQAFQSGLAAKDQLPKFQTNNIGGQTVTQQFDPVTGKVLGQTALQNTQSPDNAATNARSAADAAAGRSVTMRGQDLVDARSRDSNQAGRVPAGYRMTADNTLEFIPGGPADPNAAKRAAPTEFQGKAGMFGNRAQEADKIITDLEGKYSSGGINTKQALGRTPLIGGGLEAAGNLALSVESQKAEQAQRDFVNAVLRLESGAAISQGEFDNARKQYFRQPGDSDAVVKQKAQNRKTAIQGLMNNARPGAVEPAKGAASGGWSIQKVN